MRPHQLYYSISITYIFKYFNSFFKKFYKYPYFFNSSYQIPEKLYLFTILKGVSRILCKLIDKSSKFSTLHNNISKFACLTKSSTTGYFSHISSILFTKKFLHTLHFYFLPVNFPSILPKSWQNSSFIICLNLIKFHSFFKCLIYFLYQFSKIKPVIRRKIKN